MRYLNDEELHALFHECIEKAGISPFIRMGRLNNFS